MGERSLLCRVRWYDRARLSEVRSDRDLSKVTVGQRPGLCTHSQQGQPPLSRTWTLGETQGGGRGGTSSGCEGSTHLQIQAKASDAKPVCQAPLSLRFWPRHPADTEAYTGISFLVALHMINWTIGQLGLGEAQVLGIGPQGTGKDKGGSARGDVVFGPSAGRLPGPVLSLWMAPSMLCPAVIEHYEVFHASIATQQQPPQSAGRKCILTNPGARAKKNKGHHYRDIVIERRAGVWVRVRGGGGGGMTWMMRKRKKSRGCGMLQAKLRLRRWYRLETGQKETRCHRGGVEGEGRRIQERRFTSIRVGLGVGAWTEVSEVRDREGPSTAP
ncbi:hypothetical protein NQZ68_002023 [Dissostichus eleginoides]|nr:hypothetical protein NQZ68_002023 [Dissostichus eleginoides]